MPGREGPLALSPTTTISAAVTIVRLLCIPAANARTTSPELDAYRDFVRHSEPRRLLTVARDAMEHHWSGSTSADSTAAAPVWPDVGSATPYRAGLSETVRALAIESLHAELVRLTLRSDRGFRWVTVEEPRPAGLEVSELLPSGAQWPYGTHAEQRDDRNVFFLEEVPKGETGSSISPEPRWAGRSPGCRSQRTRCTSPSSWSAPKRRVSESRRLSSTVPPIRRRARSLVPG
jgi:hypothetical protein